MVTAITLAVLAAACNALSIVLQRKVNRDESAERAFGLGYLLHLITRPVWLIGLAALTLSFLLQAFSLSLGALSVVQPVLVLELPFALVLGSAVLRYRLRPVVWLSGTAMAAGLALMIAALDPHGGHAATLSTATILAAGGAALAGIAALVVIGWSGPGWVRGALLGASAGSGFGLTAALMKTAVARVPAHGVVGIFTAWETYAMVVTGVGSLALAQAALSAGNLLTAQPGITLMDPLVSLLWGTLVAGEHTRTGAALVLAAFGAALIAGAAMYLIRTISRSTEASAVFAPS